MKSYFYSLLIFAAAILLSLSSCIKQYDELVPNLEGVPAGGVQNVQLIGVSENTLELELKIFAVDHFGGFIQDLKASNFTLENRDNSNFGYQIHSIEKENAQPVGPYSAGLLFDQSGSINSTDPTNDRIKAGLSFANLLAGSDEASVAAFSDGGFYTSPYESLVNFSTDLNRISAGIQSLEGKADGGTPLYKAIYNLIPTVSADSRNTNKAIVAFTDGKDTEGGIAISDLVDLACLEGVKIYTIGLSGGVDESILSEIAFKTGGAVMLADDALQLISLYSSLGELLHGEGRFYNIRIQVTNPNTAWGPGSQIVGQLNLNLSSTNPVTLPFQTSLNSKNSGSLDERKVDCDCSNINAGDLVDNWKTKAADYLKSLPDELNLPTPNDQITCAYANIYNTNPSKFKWAGLAAIVSGKIGVETTKDDFWANLVTQNLSEFETNVLIGNKEVFDDLFWQHIAFNSGGIEEIGKIFCAGGIDIETYRAWLKISQSDPQFVWEGNKDLLYLEQRDILQNRIYNPHPIIWSLIQTNDASVHGTPVLVSPVPSYDDVFPSDKLFDYLTDRWAWISSTVLPAWENYESNPANKNALKAEHRNYCNSCCN